MRQLQLGNSSNWEVIHNSSVDAVQIAKVGGGYKNVPIPEISIERIKAYMSAAVASDLNP